MRFGMTGSTRDLPRSGRPRVTTPRQDRRIRLIHLRNRTQSASRTVATEPDLQHIHPQTVRNRLRESGMRCRRPVQGIILTEGHRQRRLEWAEIHRPWPRYRWSRVWFSDESRFLLNRHDGRTRVYRRSGERYARCSITEADRHGEGGVMMWGAISMTGRTQLVRIQGNLNAARYVVEILTPMCCQ